jgi:hypothetical protein
MGRGRRLKGRGSAAEPGRVNANAVAVALLALATALTGCDPVSSESDVDEDVESSGSADDDDDGDDGASHGDEDPSHGGAFFDDGGGDDGSDEDEGGDEVGGGGGGSAGLGGDGGEDDGADEGDVSTDSGEAPEDVACLDMAECMIGHPYAAEPCAASFDVTPTQCGVTPVCSRSLEWAMTTGSAIVPPDEFQVAYSFVGEQVFHNVGSVCFDPEDGHSCVTPCHLPFPKPVEKIRITYSCGGDYPLRTFQAKVASLGPTILLHC